MSTAAAVPWLEPARDRAAPGPIDDVPGGEVVNGKDRLGGARRVESRRSQAEGRRSAFERRRRDPSGRVRARERARSSVRGGGHSAPGFGTNDGELVIDLSLMRGVRVDPFGQTARAEGGALIFDVLAATDAFGLTTAFGIIGNTGIGGLSLGGGMGHLSRGLGLTIDNIISMDVVTADGKFLVASDKENEDLYWALRGGSGNFGVVTSFEYQLHPIKDIYAGVFFYPIEETRTVLEFYRDYIVSAPGRDGAVPDPPMAPAVAVHPRRAPWEDVHSHGGVLGGAARQRRESVGADPERRAAASASWSRRCRWSRSTPHSTPCTRRGCSITGRARSRAI